MEHESFEPVLLRIAEAASLLRVGRTTIYELMNSGEIPSIRIGRAVRISTRAVREYAARAEAEQNTRMG